MSSLGKKRRKKCGFLEGFEIDRGKMLSRIKFKVGLILWWERLGFDKLENIPYGFS